MFLCLMLKLQLYLETSCHFGRVVSLCGGVKSGRTGKKKLEEAKEAKLVYFHLYVVKFF